MDMDRARRRHQAHGGLLGRWTRRARRGDVPPGLSRLTPRPRTAFNRRLAGYLTTVKDEFGAKIDYAQIVRKYGRDPKADETHYSPAVCTGIAVREIERRPRPTPHFNELRRASEPHDAHVDAPLQALDERLLEEERRPGRRRLAAIHATTTSRAPIRQLARARHLRWPHVSPIMSGQRRKSSPAS